MKHVLDALSLEELTYLITSNYVPSRLDQRKGPAELTSQHCKQLAERKLGIGSKVDVVTAFKQRWKLDVNAEKKLRELTHKDLRYVMEKFDKSTSVEEVIIEATD